jgi:DNA repair photolyase
MLKVCLTERGDPAFDPTFEKRLGSANIIITKNVAAITPVLLTHKEKIILHATVTGYGGTLIEPNVPPTNESMKALRQLILEGFPKEQIVLRVDPIFPSTEIYSPSGNVANVPLILNYDLDLYIKRVRISYLDIGTFTRKRFEKFLKLGVDVTCKKIIKESMTASLSEFRKYFENYIFKTYHGIEWEMCAEKTELNLPCISQKDLDILGIKAELTGSSNQRSSCKCPANKHDILNSKERCPHQCLYCYWPDAEPKPLTAFELFTNTYML